jgi:hypothetical protein
MSNFVHLYFVHLVGLMGFVVFWVVAARHSFAQSGGLPASVNLRNLKTVFRHLTVAGSTLSAKEEPKRMKAMTISLWISMVRDIGAIN